MIVRALRNVNNSQNGKRGGTPPGHLYGCQTKGVAEGGICKDVRPKELPDNVVDRFAGWKVGRLKAKRLRTGKTG